MNNWKTTAAGILSALIGTSGPVTAFIGALEAAKAVPDYTLTITGAALTLVFGIARVWVGLLQNDATAIPTQTPSITPKPANTKLGAWALIAILLQGSLIAGGTVTMVTLTGCPLTATQTKNEIDTILQEAGAILAVADPGLRWTGDLAKAAAILKADEAAWIKGGAVQDVINVLNDILSVTALISPLVPYASLIAVLVGGIEAALALLLPASPASGTSSAGAHITMQAHSNPWSGRVTITSAKDSRAKWNAIVKENPSLAKAKIA